MILDVDNFNYGVSNCAIKQENIFINSEYFENVKKQQFML